MQKWIIPTNIKNYDIVEHVKTNKILFFKKNRALTKGDIAYIYLAKPYAQILYKAIVLDDKVKSDELTYPLSVGNDKAKLYIKVEIVRTFGADELTYEVLKKHGLGQVVNQQLVRGELETFIVSKE